MVVRILSERTTNQRSMKTTRIYKSTTLERKGEGDTMPIRTFSTNFSSTTLLIKTKEKPVISSGIFIALRTYTKAFWHKRL